MFGRGVESEGFSEKVSAEVDAEVSKIMKEAEEKAKTTIEANKKLLEAIATRLMEVETMERDEFEILLKAHGVTPKKKLDIEHQV